MNKQFSELMQQAKVMHQWENRFSPSKFTEVLLALFHERVVTSILITDVLISEKGLTPTSEDYIEGINKDFHEFVKNLLSDVNNVVL